MPARLCSHTWLPIRITWACSGSADPLVSSQKENHRREPGTLRTRVLRVTRKQFSEVRRGTPAPHHRGKGKCRKRGVRAPLCRSGAGARAFRLPKERRALLFCIQCLIPGAWRSLPTQVPKSSGSRWLGGEGYGCPGLALGPPLSFPHSFFLSCLLLWPEEMEWAGGGPLSSHPLPEPKSGVTLPPPRARERSLCCRGSVWSHRQDWDPPPSHQGPQPSRCEPLPYHLSGHCSGKNRATQPGPAPVPVPPVTLSCHSPERLHLPTKLPRPRLSRLAAGGGTFCVSSLPLSSSSLRLREVPQRAHVTQPIRRRI